MCDNMSKIIIILLLSTGVYSLLDGDNVEDVPKQEVVNDDEPEKVTLSKEVDTQNEETPTPPTDDSPKLARAPKKAKTVGLNKEQVDMLAEKVIRIHGVNLDGDDEENQKNIDKLRRVVANVEKDLNEKLKLSQAKIQTNANPNGKDAVVKEAAASDAVQTQEGNETPVENPESNPFETENLGISKENTQDGEEKTEDDVVDETTNIENEEVERDAEDVGQTENENVSEEVETQSEADNDEEVDKPESTFDKTDINKEEETSDTENNDGVGETNEAEEEGSDVDNTNPEENENEEVAEEDVEEDEAVQNDIGQDVNESSFTESSPENESDNVKNVEDELPGACTLNDGCDETDTIHAYSEEYNTGKIAEQELEDTVEDTHLQRLIKYVTSFF